MKYTFIILMSFADLILDNFLTFVNKNYPESMYQKQLNKVRKNPINQ